MNKLLDGCAIISKLCFGKRVEPCTSGLSASYLFQIEQQLLQAAVPAKDGMK